ncbi:DNA internalization-related competence protein ComEC/Rec2 [Thiocapsa imhoffii]|uniref:DNA internalization-related competence protein ComEC/Rec2 n=1 Tax=Thiocapsa imhoffii TaxID=382777 RepID=A0A9X0WKR0_9GAMM|nr:DNA internalization-related competence protein ComEC/Rec2 [Thiocapsa imhoffii]MBK1646531.1 DNA internalization-related competence protein ComEC/Rec2 [Thiocapsa imhoffii]
MTRPTLARVGLAFAAGVMLMQLLPRFPPLTWTIAAALLCVAAAWRWRALRLPAALLLGACWAQWHACLILCVPFPDALARAPLMIEGRVDSIPSELGHARRFLFAVDRVELSDEEIPFTGLVRLSWYGDAPPLRVGERWRLPVRLKPRHGLANPGTFDYERWLFEHGVKATGNLRRGEAPARLDAGPGRYGLDRLRQDLANHLALVLAERPARALVQALVIGDRSGFDQEQWEILTRTGTNHLVAISGLHVGLIAGALFILVRWLWSRSARLTMALAAPRAAAVAALIAALGYAALAGFAVSTQRALIMLAVVLAALFWLRTLRPYHALLLALVGVLLVDPGAVLAAGFWLSFGAVAVLLYSLGQRLPRRDLWTRWGHAQWAVAIGLLPLLFLLFGRASLIAPLVNLVAVPIFSLLLLPLVLVSSLLSLLPGFGGVTQWPLQWTASLLGWCLDGLAWIAALPWAAITLPAPAPGVWLLAMAGAILLLAPRGLPGRWLGLLLVMPLFLVRPPTPAEGEAWFTLLDVGLGLAVVVRTQEGTLVYDTGPGFPSGFNTGSTVVAPFLTAQGVRAIERVVISHADRDHAGGLVGLLERIPVAHLSSGEPERLGLPGVVPCRAGEGWDWSGVSFRFLHPEDASLRGNDASCVLRVEAGGRAILLTGDIEARTERRLARALGDALASDILVAGHHGSATSTQPEFLDAVAPSLVLFASGYANQFGFPAAVVRERVSARGIAMLDTGLLGAIDIRIQADGRMQGPRAWREVNQRFWTHRPTGWPTH